MAALGHHFFGEAEAGENLVCLCDRRCHIRYDVSFCSTIYVANERPRPAVHGSRKQIETITRPFKEHLKSACRAAMIVT
jgi:hypothetical protein